MQDDLSFSDDQDWDLPLRERVDIAVRVPTTFEPLKPPPRESRRGVLSNAEIEALLRPDFSEPMPELPVNAHPRALPSFETPIAPPSDDADARRIAAKLSLAFRQGCGLMAAATPLGASRGDFIDALLQLPAERGRATLCFAGASGEIDAMLILSASLASLILDAACGGRGQSAPARALTRLDADVLETLLAPLGAALGDDLRLASVDIDAEFTVSLAQPGGADITDTMIRLAGGRGAARLIQMRTPGAPAVATPPTLPLAAPVRSVMIALLTARLASLSVPLSRIADLKAGSTLLLGLPADQPVQLLSGGRDGAVALEGDIGRKGKAMALRVSRRGPALSL